jgi:predicted hydrocarbon binding protein
MKQRVFKATLIVDGDGVESLRLEDLRSNLENLLGHMPYGSTLELEEDMDYVAPIDVEFESPCETCRYGKCPVCGAAAGTPCDAGLHG